MGPLRQAPRPLFPVRGRENATTIAGHRLLRALDSTNTSWEVAGANGAHCILRVADELPGGETRGGRRASSRRLKARAALKHPNLLRVLGGGDTERGPYTLLELPAARPLSAVIAEDGPLDPLRTVRLLQGVAEALDLANAQGLIHLELSPQNILVENREDGRALLMDFGISPEVSRVRVGLTPDYRSPDELRHLPPEQASNVYSLACVAWACLTGHPPFVRQSPVAVSYAHTSDPPPVLTAERSDLPEHVDKVMEAALAKEPGDRYRSSGAFMRALAAAVGAPSDQAESPAAPPAEAPDRSTPPNGRGAAPKANGRPAPRPPTSAPPFPLQPAREPRRERVRRPPPTTERPKPGSNGGAPARPAPKAAPAPKRAVDSRSAGPAPTAAAPPRAAAARTATPPATPAAPKRAASPAPAASRAPTSPSRPAAELRPASVVSPPRAGGSAKTRLAALGVTLALAAGAAGWLLGTQPEPEPVRPDTAAIARAEAASAAVRERNAWRAQADRAVAQLDSRRAAGRRRLRAARTRPGQALRARQLAGVFGATAAGLGEPPESFEAGAALEPALRRAERAYRSLGTAARSGRGFRSASAAVRRSESGLNGAIRALDAG